jgi:6-phosphogluconolactonase
LAVSNAGIMPYGIAIDPFGRFLYVTNIDQPNPEPFGPVSHVSAYRIGIDGTLTPVPGSPFPAGYSPLSVAADPLGRFVYVGNAGSQEEVSETISGYRVGGDGTLIPLPGSPFRDGESPQEILADPLGRFVYTAGEYDLAYLTYRITGTGIPAYLPGSSFRLGGGYSPYNTIAVDPLGRFAYQASAEGDPRKGTVSVYQVGANGPALASSFISTPFFDSMVVDLSGEFLYAQTGQAVSVYRIAGDGSLVPVGSPFQLGFSPNAMVVAPARELILEEQP